MSLDTSIPPFAPPTSLPEPEPTPAPPPHAYPLFLGGMASWFTGWGLQHVLLQWLIVEQLRESPARVGTAQMALLLPSLLFLLVGGALADRVDRRRALLALHALAALACTTLGVCVGTGALSYALVVGYAAVAGTLQAFALPMRDALLSDVIHAGIGRAVAGLTVVQHAGNGLGAIAGGLAGLLGAPALLGAQALMLLAGGVAYRRMPANASMASAVRPPLHLKELLPGLLEVARSPILRPLFLLNVSVGLVFISAYLVLLPLMVRELYGGGSGRIAGLVGALPVGTIAVTLGIAARGGLARPGLWVLLGQGFAALCLCAMSLGLPYWGAFTAVIGWGIGGAFAINGSRTLFQVHASEANRGRVLSVYSFAVLGAGPLGALGTGLIADSIGTLATLATHGTCMVLGMLAMAAFTRVQQFR